MCMSAMQTYAMGILGVSSANTFIKLTYTAAAGRIRPMGSDGYEKVFYSTFGKMLGETRRKRGISQEMLADELGLSRTTITNIEKGRQPVQLHTIYLIARLLSIDIKELLPSPTVMDLPNEVGELSVSRSEWLEQMNVKLPRGANDEEKKESGRRSKKLAAE